MSRGSYLGGGTVISPWRRSLIDVEIDEWKKNSPRKKNSDGQKKEKKTSTPESVQQEAFLITVIYAEVRSKPLPGVPKPLKYKIEAEVSRLGGILQWAKKQSCYKKHKEKVLAKEERIKQKRLSKELLSNKKTHQKEMARGPEGLRRVSNPRPKKCLHCQRPWGGFYLRNMKPYTKCCNKHIKRGQARATPWIKG